MINLFNIEEYKVIPNKEALMIFPYSSIWNDNTKEMALLKFAYIEFMSSYKKSNPFIGYPEKDRGDKILDKILTNSIDPASIKDDVLVQQGIEVYKQFQEESVPTIRLYNSSLIAADKLQDFFLTFDFTKISPKTGLPLYKPADITRALKDVNEIIKTLNSIKKQVYQELDETAKGKAGRDINYFEIPKNTG